MSTKTAYRCGTLHVQPDTTCATGHYMCNRTLHVQRTQSKLLLEEMAQVLLRRLNICFDGIL